MKNFARLFGRSAEDKLAENTLLQAVPAISEPMASDNEVFATNEIYQVDIAVIMPNPFQPRKIFSEEALVDLSASIKQFGIIQPLLVRRCEQGFQLIAGERRLRAAKLSGLTAVPVIIKELSDKEMAELAMIENLQREDLHYLEEAEGFHQLIVSFGFTQEQLAERVGKKQSTVANKLRLLKLSPQVRQVLHDDGLTERHARALLKLEDTEQQTAVLLQICQQSLNVRQTEELVEAVLADISREISGKDKSKQKLVKVIRDVRIFVNTIHHVVDEMKRSGLKIHVQQEQDEDYIMIHLRIPKRK